MPWPQCWKRHEGGISYHCHDNNWILQDMLTIRHAILDDIPLIRELCFQVWPQTYAPMLSQAQIGYMLDMMYSVDSLTRQFGEGADYLLCHDEGVPVGFASVVDHGDGSFKLEKLYVVPGQHGKGAGRFIIDYITGSIAAKGARTLQLQVNKRNPAKRFYEKLGFTVAKEAVFDIGNGFVMDDYVMEMTVSKSPTPTRAG